MAQSPPPRPPAWHLMQSVSSGERLALVLVHDVRRACARGTRSTCRWSCRGMAGLAGRLLLVACRGRPGRRRGRRSTSAPAGGGVATAAVLAERALVLVVLGVARVAVLRRLLVVLRRLAPSWQSSHGTPACLPVSLKANLLWSTLALPLPSWHGRQSLPKVASCSRHERRVHGRVAVRADGLVERPRSPWDGSRRRRTCRPLPFPVAAQREAGHVVREGRLVERGEGAARPVVLGVAAAARGRRTPPGERAVQPVLAADLARLPSSWQARHVSAMVRELHGAGWQAPQSWPSCGVARDAVEGAACACAFSAPGLKSTGPASVRDGDDASSKQRPRRPRSRGGEEARPLCHQRRHLALQRCSVA